MQRDILLLSEMVDAAEQAQRLVAGLSAAEVGADRMRRESLLWNFTVLGEAATLVSSETKARFPDIPWRNPVRLRNRVVHGYWSVDVEILHTTAVEQLGEFARLLRDALAALNRTREPTRSVTCATRGGCCAVHLASTSSRCHPPPLSG